MIDFLFSFQPRLYRALCSPILYVMYISLAMNIVQRDEEILSIVFFERIENDRDRLSLDYIDAHSRASVHMLGESCASQTWTIHSFVD